MEQISIPLVSGKVRELAIGSGVVLFIVGANGAGKSNLIQHLYGKCSMPTRRITAHRRNWLDSDATSLSPAERANVVQYVASENLQSDSVWREIYPGQRVNAAMFDLAAAENDLSRRIAAAFRQNDETGLRDLKATEGPVASMNRLLRLSNVAVEISINSDETIVARKLGSEPFGIRRLSDGERNAVLLAAEVLTAAPGSLLLIDEPERHLSRAITPPLLTQLLGMRDDCCFIISTHELELPVENPKSITVLLRGVSFGDHGEVASWDAEVIQPGLPIDDTVKRDILGGRRNLLFVEGEPSSLDRPLYSLVFPQVPIVAKGTSRDVIHATTSVRSTKDLLWLEAFGIIDNDGRSEEEISDLRGSGVFALPVFSIESLFYDPELQRRAAMRLAGVDGGDLTARLGEALSSAVAEIGKHRDRLCLRASEKSLRAAVFRMLPTLKQLESASWSMKPIDPTPILSAELQRFDALVEARDLAGLVARYPVRDTGALSKIASGLGFKGRREYQGAVRMLLATEPGAIAYVRNLFGDLPKRLGITD